MQTTNRSLFLTNYIPKIQLSAYLEISRHTFDFYLNNPGKWRNYQMEKIDELFDYVKEITEDRNHEVIKMYFKNGCLISDVRIIRKLY